MKSIDPNELVSITLLFAVEIYGIEKAWRFYNGREVIYISSLDLWGISRGKQIGDGVVWIKKKISP